MGAFVKASGLPSQLNNAGKALITDGTKTSWGSAGAVATAGDCRIATLGVSASTTSLTYVKALEYLCPFSGAIRTVMTLINNSSNRIVTGRIYVNGSAVGTERVFGPGTATAQAYSEDITVKSGDAVQVYLHSEGGGTVAAVLDIAVNNGVTLNTPRVVSGTGAPGAGGNAVVAVAGCLSVGDIYLNVSGGVSTTLYVKTASNAWTAK